MTTLLGGPHGNLHGGVVLGWVERATLCVVLIGGWPLWVAAVVAAKGAYVALSLRYRDAAARQRLWRGTAVSLAWGMAVAVPLAYVMPMMQ